MKTDVSKLSKEGLLQKTKQLVVDERRITLELIDHLREVERRLLFAELGYGSLFEFATKHLGLSEGSAQRRIQAMRLVRDVPEAKPALESGKLSLSNAAKVQTFFQMEKKTRKDRSHQNLIRLPSAPNPAGSAPTRSFSKQEIIKNIQGLSQRECEQKLYEISPQSVPRERERVISAQERELKIIVTEETYQKLQRLKGLLAHAMPEANYAQILEHMTELTLKTMQKKKGLEERAPEKNSGSASKITRAQDRGSSSAAAAVRTEKLCSENVPEDFKTLSLKLPPPGVRGHVPTSIRRAVWARAQGRCEYEGSAQQCPSRHRLEIDHRIPLALGGGNDVQNLRLLCRTHNTHQAVYAGIRRF